MRNNIQGASCRGVKTAVAGALATLMLASGGPANAGTGPNNFSYYGRINFAP